MPRAIEIMNHHRLLVVEADERSRRALRAIFSRRGWDVILAGTVAEALELLDPAPDYLILDLSLPDGGGEAILRKIRDANLKTRVAVTTGMGEPGRLHRIHELKPEAIFVKPIDLVDLWREGELARVG